MPLQHFPGSGVRLLVPASGEQDAHLGSTHRARRGQQVELLASLTDPAPDHPPFRARQGGVAQLVFDQVVPQCEAQSSVEVQENHKDAKNCDTKADLATGFCGYHSSDPGQDCGSDGRPWPARPGRRNSSRGL
ncbi:hypothetical protein [Kitasatospora sp. NPDC005751]|uniref:hypothetical protein n=1 Tax=unclassified Kitasatospora TaxID=2633591 RepID=UPI0033F22DFD